MSDAKLYPCPCCGYLVLPEGPGLYEICRICRWEDDPGQLRSPWLPGGANRLSLIEAQRTYAEIGASSPERAARSTGPLPTDHRDPGWRPFELARDKGGQEQEGQWPADRVTLYWWRTTYWRAKRN